MKKPIIGISGSIIVDKSEFPGYKKVYVNNDYIEAVIKAGGVPLVLAITEDESVIDGYIDSIDGLILTGGHDVTPRYYGENPKPKLGDVFPERDEFDLKLLEKSKNKNIPILGICRGFQLMNVAHGGSLWQDLSYSDYEYIKHNQEHNPELKTHSLEIEEDSKLYEIFGEKNIYVNSFHHQIIKKVSNEFNVAATAPDGIIEALEHKNYDFLVGVQFHPEMLHRVCGMMQNLFNTFIEKAKEKK